MIPDDEVRLTQVTKKVGCPVRNGLGVLTQDSPGGCPTTGRAVVLR